MTSRFSKMTLLKIALNFKKAQRNMGYIHNRSKYWLERYGNREMVGYGMNGQPAYIDDPNFPFPALRFKETTPQIQALYEKQKGDWKRLTKEEKKTLYRSNFRQTFAEFQAPNSGEWMGVIGLGLIGCSLGVWLYMFMAVFVEPDLPESFKPSHIRAQMRRLIDMQADPIRGLTSNWDYERNDWKVKTWNTPPNPFIRCPDDDD